MAIRKALQNTRDQRRSAISRTSTKTEIDRPATSRKTRSQASSGGQLARPSRIESGAIAAKATTPTSDDAMASRSDQANSVAEPWLRSVA